MGMVRHREIADDLFQETFLRVIAAIRRERGSYERQGRWLAWVMRIARNTALDHLRRRKKWRDVDSGDGEESYWDQVPDDVPVADERLNASQQAARLEACIARLPREQREVVMLRHDAELTFREIAEMTGVSINTALGRMRYALINLRKMMEVTAKQDIKTA
jgi:RNA polymerase sigma-70 factor (ECF subfamily)